MKRYSKHLMPPPITSARSGSRSKTHSRSQSRPQTSSEKKPEAKTKQKARVQSLSSTHKSKMSSALSSDELTAQRLQAQWDREDELIQTQLQFALNLEHQSSSPSQLELDRLEAQRLQVQIEEEQAEFEARRAARLEVETEEAIRLAVEWDNEDSHIAALQQEWDEQERRHERNLAAAQAVQTQWEQEFQEQQEQSRQASQEEERSERESTRRRATEAADAQRKSKLDKERAARKQAEKKVELETQRLQRQQADKKARLDRDNRVNEEAAKKIQLEAQKKEKVRISDAKKARELAEEEKQRVSDAKKARELAEKEKKARQADCVSCMETMEKAKMCSLSCKHAYCGDCIGGAFRSALSSKKQFSCCKLKAPVNLASQWLDAIFIASYRLLVLEQATKNPRYCSNKECTMFIPPANIHGTIAICRACNVHTCAPCGNKEHSGVCKEDKEGQAVQALAEREGWRNCPKCNFVIEKNEGCLHMTCKCHFEWCWECKREWEICKSTCKRE